MIRQAHFSLDTQKMVFASKKIMQQNQRFSAGGAAPANLMISKGFFFRFLQFAAG
jgi:hypothetical protein